MDPIDPLPHNYAAKRAFLLSIILFSIIVYDINCCAITFPHSIPVLIFPAKRTPNFISGRGSGGLVDLTLPILLYKSTFSSVNSFYSFKIHCNIAFNK